MRFLAVVRLCGDRIKALVRMEAEHLTDRDDPVIHVSDRDPTVKVFRK